MNCVVIPDHTPIRITWPGPSACFVNAIALMAQGACRLNTAFDMTHHEELRALSAPPVSQNIDPVPR
jgi:hypothetical protein